MMPDGNVARGDEPKDGRRPVKAWEYEHLLSEYHLLRENNAELRRILARCQQIIDDYYARTGRG